MLLLARQIGVDGTLQAAGVAASEMCSIGGVVVVGGER